MLFLDKLPKIYTVFFKYEYYGKFLNAIHYEYVDVPRYGLAL
jgi:hypothetical protein